MPVAAQFADAIVSRGIAKFGGSAVEELSHLLRYTTKLNLKAARRVFVRRLFPKFQDLMQQVFFSSGRMNRY